MRINVCPILNNAFEDKVILEFKSKDPLYQYSVMVPLNVFYSEESGNYVYTQLLNKKEIELEFDVDDVLKRIVSRK